MESNLRRDAPPPTWQNAGVKNVLLFAVTILSALPIPVAGAFDEKARSEMLARFQREEEALDEQIAQSPESVPLFSRRGDARLFRGRFAEAVADYEKMIALDPTQDSPHWRLGIAYYFIGDFAKSARQFQKYHAYEARDRENGVWKFLAQARAEGIAKARAEMLVYTQFDREPFPILYEMFAGKKTGPQVFADLAGKKLATDSRVSFFANYYVGLYEELAGQKVTAQAHLQRAVDEAWEAGATKDLGYMWQVARLQREVLEAGTPQPGKPNPASRKDE